MDLNGPGKMALQLTMRLYRKYLCHLSPPIWNGQALCEESIVTGVFFGVFGLWYWLLKAHRDILDEFLSISVKICAAFSG